MQQPKMIVLSLIAQGMHYGLEMEAFVERTGMREWAQIGGSTIYKTLRDLNADGLVTERKEPAKRGPGKNVYSLNKKGREQLSTLIEEALNSKEAVYSDRIAGMFFSLSLSGPEAVEKLARGIDATKLISANIQKHKTLKADEEVAQIVLGYYEKVYDAEREALVQMRQFVNDNFRF